MSIRNLLNPQYKAWLTVNLGTVNAKELSIGSGDTLNLNAGSILNMQSSVGANGDIVEKDGSNELSWVPYVEYGSERSSVDNPATFTNTTVNWSTVEFLTGTDLPPGNYIVQYSMEIQNATGICFARFLEGAVEKQHWTINGFIPDYESVSGFIPFTVASTSTITWSYQFRSLIGATTTSARRTRITVYKVS